ncbi:hypothetical protein [Teredinibacter purpureus]|uniref:hypothetical protein n=1 Tax=Teredinibacter purpureus TaxID=2731756 RepID=UPI0005F82DA9|nr:hypothetical protein [Teredinibacter purpureus]
MDSVIAAVLKGNKEALQQCLGVLNTVTDTHYTLVQPPVVVSSLGSHFRHILDIYRALMLAESHNTEISGDSRPLVNYDKRRRGASCERDIAMAKSEIAALQCWLQGLDEQRILGCIWVQSEVALEETNSVVVGSSLLRELIFASSHAVHHLAIISMVANVQCINIDSGLGVAPATATFLRDQAKTNA